MNSPTTRRALSVIGRPQHQKSAAKGSPTSYEQIIPTCCLNSTVNGQCLEYPCWSPAGSGKDLSAREPWWTSRKSQPPGLSPIFSLVQAKLAGLFLLFELWLDLYAPFLNYRPSGSIQPFRYLITRTKLLVR
jgi:hypothetical protein